jgi:uroporphyrinogen decarboxylase
MYREFALPYEQRIFEAIHRKGGLARLHICGNTNHILAEMLESGADIIDLDWMVDMEKAAALYGDRAAVCGNFNPVTIMLQGRPAAVEQAVLTCAQQGGPRWFCGAGCEIPDGSPYENLYAQARTLQALQTA